MGFFGFLGTKELEQFANGMAADLTRRFPPKSESRTDAGAQHQLKVILDGIGARAIRYRDEKKLGVYGKAKMANSFKWRLSEAGYSKEFVETATKNIVTRLAATPNVEQK